MLNLFRRIVFCFIHQLVAKHWSVAATVLVCCRFDFSTSCQGAIVSKQMANQSQRAKSVTRWAVDMGRVQSEKQAKSIRSAYQHRAIEAEPKS
jgi:hypothetical protein